MSNSCVLTINGQKREVAADGAATLLTVLRDQLLLCGAKRGCNQGVCGACTVLVNGRSARACLALALNCEGLDVVTVEGIARFPLGEALQRAFVECGAVQCGFCTPGMLIAAYELLRDTPQVDVAQVREGLSGNICRCSGYRKIVEAVLQAAQEMRE